MRYTYEVEITKRLTVAVEAPEGSAGEAAARIEAIRECRIHGGEDWQATKIKEWKA